MGPRETSRDTESKNARASEAARPRSDRDILPEQPTWIDTWSQHLYDPQPNSSSAADNDPSSFEQPRVFDIDPPAIATFPGKTGPVSIPAKDAASLLSAARSSLQATGKSDVDKRASVTTPAPEVTDQHRVSSVASGLRREAKPSSVPARATVLDTSLPHTPPPAADAGRIIEPASPFERSAARLRERLNAALGEPRSVASPHAETEFATVATKPRLADFLREKVKLANAFLHTLDQRQWAIYTIVAIAGAGLVYLFKDHQHGNTVEVIVASEGGSLIQQSFAGEVISSKTVELVTPLSGLVTRVHATKGDRVSRDQTLISFDTRDATLRVDIANDKLNGLNTRVRTVRRVIDELNRGVKNGEIAVRAVDAVALELADLQAQQKTAEHELALARRQLDQLTVKAPFDGQIDEVMAVPQTWVAPYQPLVRVVDPSVKSVVFQVPGADAALLETGQTVALRTAQSTGAIWEQLITHIRKNADGSSSATIALSDVAPPLEIGATVTGTFLGTHSSAFMLPVQAIRRDDKGTWVAVEDDEKVRLVAVTLGKQSARYVEVLRGLETGQRVILTKQALQAGQHVHGVTVWAGAN